MHAYELCTRVSPLEDPDVFAVFNTLAQGSYAPPPSLAPDIRHRIDNAIIGCLAVDPKVRIDSCTRLGQVLQGAEGWTSQTFIVDGHGSSAPASKTATPPQLAKIPSRLDSSPAPQDSLPATRTRLRLMGGGTLSTGLGVGLIGPPMVVVVVGGLA